MTISFPAHWPATCIDVHGPHVRMDIVCAYQAFFDVAKTMNDSTCTDDVPPKDASEWVPQLKPSPAYMEHAARLLQSVCEDYADVFDATMLIEGSGMLNKHGQPIQAAKIERDDIHDFVGDWESVCDSIEEGLETLCESGEDEEEILGQIEDSLLSVQSLFFEI